MQHEVQRKFGNRKVSEEKGHRRDEIKVNRRVSMDMRGISVWRGTLCCSYATQRGGSLFRERSRGDFTGLFFSHCGVYEQYGMIDGW